MKLDEELRFNIYDVYKVLFVAGIILITIGVLSIGYNIGYKKAAAQEQEYKLRYCDCFKPEQIIKNYSLPLWTEQLNESDQDNSDSHNNENR